MHRRPIKLWVDDERDPADFEHAGWEWAKNHHDAIQHLTRPTTQVTHLSLDHDLGDPYQDGYHIAVFLEKAAAAGQEVPPFIFCHSQNPVGRMRIEAAIRSIRELEALRQLRAGQRWTTVIGLLLAAAALVWAFFRGGNVH